MAPVATLGVLLGLLSAWQPAGAYENGAPPGHTSGFGEPDCSACHSDYEVNPTEGSLKVAGLPDAYLPGASYEVTIVLRYPMLASGGFQLALRDNRGAPAGEWHTIDAGVTLLQEGKQTYLQHARANRDIAEDGSVRWRATWCAPADSVPVVLHVAANASNDDASALGDRIFLQQRRVLASSVDAANGEE